MPADIRISWCKEAGEARKLADFFADNVTVEYISHSELQGPRTVSPTEWAPGLPDLLRHEIEPRVRDTAERVPAATSRPVAVAERAGVLVGVSLVTFAGGAPVPFAVIEDLVVGAAERGRGIGKAMMDWIAAEATARGICRLFLESGRANHRAHEFFEREGFATCSIVMMRSLDRPG